MAQPKLTVGIASNLVWCPVCSQYTQALRITDAATIATVDRRTIYRYIEEGSVHAFKIAGKRYRVCKGCLIKDEPV